MDTAVLVLDDDPDVLKAARLALAAVTAQVDTARSAEGLEGAIAAGAYQVILLDMNFALGKHSGEEGLDWLGRIRQLAPATSVVPMTTYGAVSLAVEALKRGAVDFVLKPWRNERLTSAVTAAAELAIARTAGASLNLDRLERQAVECALAQCGGNVSRAAAALGLTRPALYRRMAKHGL
jgi:two-component system response regulator RegA